MAANADPTFRALVSYLARRTGLPITMLEGLPWSERQALLERGLASVGAICGATYVRLTDQHEAALQLLAAPVMLAARYEEQPVYFSDIVVPAASRAQTFGDLRGGCLAYNEPQSFSGYQIVRAHLAAHGETGGFFSRTIKAGSHQAVLRMVAAGAADAAAIDSTVLERELDLQPELPAQIRTIAALGPSPIPPLVVTRQLPAALAHTLRATLIDMHRETEGRTILQAGMLSRFVAVEDADYDPIRAQLQRASTITLNGAYSQDL